VTTPPSNLPRYRLLTGPDDEAFCRRVSEAPVMGFELYGSPAATNNGKEVTVAKALVRSRHGPGRTSTVKIRTNTAGEP